MNCEHTSKLPVALSPTGRDMGSYGKSPIRVVFVTCFPNRVNVVVGRPNGSLVVS